MEKIKKVLMIARLLTFLGVILIVLSSCSTLGPLSKNETKENSTDFEGIDLPESKHPYYPWLFKWKNQGFVWLFTKGSKTSSCVEGRVKDYYKLKNFIEDAKVENDLREVNPDYLVWSRGGSRIYVFSSPTKTMSFYSCAEYFNSLVEDYHYDIGLTVKELE